MNHRLALVAGLAVVYALCYSVIKAGLEFAPPLRYAGYRTVVGGGALVAYLVVRRQSAIPPRSTWRTVGWLAVLGTSILYGAMFLSPGVTGAGISSVLGNTGPLFAVVIAAPVLGERITGRKLASLVVGVGGAALIAYPAVTDPSAPGVLAGILPLTAAAAAASSAVFLKRAKVGDALLPVIAWQLLLGGAALLALSAAFESGRTVAWTWRLVGYLVFLSLGGTTFATAAWYWLVQREDVGRLSISLMVLVPVVGMALAWAFFGETVRASSALGAALAVGAVAVVARVPGRSDPGGDSHVPRPRPSSFPRR